jgi:Fic family protein
MPYFWRKYHYSCQISPSSIASTLDETQLIAQLIAAHEEGAGISELARELSNKGIAISRRTLQRRLDRLLQEAAITQSGGSRSVGYRAAQNKLAQDQKPEEDRESIIPLATGGLEVRSTVRQPIALRKPLGYDRSFLERYQPGVESYLSTEKIRKLTDLGQMTQARLPAGTYARDVLDRLLVDLSWASSRLEGNTYTRLGTQRLIELGQAAQGKDAQETQMILNHKAAIELLIENSAEVSIDKFTVLNLHAILSDNLIADPLASGRLRQRVLQISGTVFVPLAMPQQLAECFELIRSKAQAISNPFEQAFFSMVRLPYLQPFEDVNKRVSRLATNIPLLRNGLCPLSFIDVPERAYIEATLGVYEMNRVDLLRDVFMWAYERSCQRYLAIRQSVGEPDAFRMQYREAIQQTVQAVVRGNLVGATRDITQLAVGQVSTPDLEPFIEAVTQDLDHLYEGNYARYRLKFSELIKWGYRRAQVLHS